MSSKLLRAASLAVLCLLGMAATTPRARAAAPSLPASSKSPVEEARERFSRGVQLFHEGSFEASLAEFQKAYQLAPSYRLHYNIAQVQYELHDYVESLRAFWKYLAQGGNEVAPARRSEVEAEIKKLEKRVGFLSITSSVDGAQIAVDGVPMGISPFSVPVLVNPGSRRVTATKAGFVPAQSTITAAGGERLQVALQLSPHPTLGGINLLPRPSPFGDAESAGARRTWISLGVAGALALGTAVSAILAQNAETNFERELARVPNTRASIDDARTSMKRYAAVTDVLLGATAVASAVTIYFAVQELDGFGGERAQGGGPKSPRAPQRRPALAVSPAVGGLTVWGHF
jgi:hypothetical protein